MKKSLIALAIASSVTPMIAQADSPLYGRVEMRIVSEKNEELDASIHKARFGVKDQLALKNTENLIGVYQVEFQFDANESSDESTTEAASSSVKNDVTVRKAFVGLKSNFGELYVGRLNNPAYSAYKNDNFKKGSAGFASTRSRLGNAISYYSPAVNGFNAFAAIAADDTNTDDNVDISVFGARYKVKPFDVVLAATRVQDDYLGSLQHKDIINLGIRYSQDNLTLNASYENAERETGVDQQLLALTAAYKMGHTVFKLGRDELSVDGGVDKEQWILHAGYNLDPRADIYIQYNAENDGAGDDDAISTGLNIHF